jgi:DNA helicase-2/ATP-dependent DNA helicase PcrA
MTRAKNRVVISFAATRRLHNQWLSCLPSRFIDELPAAEVDITADPGLYSGRDFGGTGLGEAALAPYAVFGSERAGRGPGYQRLRNAGRQRPDDVIVGHARALSGGSLRDEPGAVAVGARVFHQKFGYGTVTAADGNKLEIAFEKAGTKKVMGSFVEVV